MREIDVIFVKFFLADWVGAVAHLTPLEELMYFRLLQAYYSRERPLPADEAGCFKLARARTKEERSAVASALAEFFERRDDGFHQRRADEEILRYRARVEANRANGKSGGRPKANLNPSESESVPDGPSSEKRKRTEKEP